MGMGIVKTNIKEKKNPNSRINQGPCERRCEIHEAEEIVREGVIMPLDGNISTKN